MSQFTYIIYYEDENRNAYLPTLELLETGTDVSLSLGVVSIFILVGKLFFCCWYSFCFGYEGQGCVGWSWLLFR